MISQAIMIVLLTGLIGLVVALIRALHANSGQSDAQIRLRQASHLFLRDLQGLGGDVGARAADIVTVIDGGTTGPDQLSIFKRDSTVCNGEVAVDGVPAPTLTLKATPGPPPVCPILAAGPCSEAGLVGQRVIVRGKQRSIVLVVDAVDAAACKLTFGAGGANATAVAKYIADHPTPVVTSLATVLTSLGGLANTSSVLFGTSLDYRIEDTRLQRRVNSISPTGFQNVLFDTVDMQIARGFDLNRNGALDANELEHEPGFTAALAAAGGAGANASNFMGVQISLMTSAKASDGVIAPPPLVFGNHVLGTQSSDKRYRWSSIFAAARNQ
jgi:hypothetical protein